MLQVGDLDSIAELQPFDARARDMNETRKLAYATQRISLMPRGEDQVVNIISDAEKLTQDGRIYAHQCAFVATREVEKLQELAYACLLQRRVIKRRQIVDR